MQYLLLCCSDETQWAKLSDAEEGRIMGEYRKLLRELKTSGRLLAGAKLSQSANAVTFMCTTSMPARRAASALPPVA